MPKGTGLRKNETIKDGRLYFTEDFQIEPPKGATDIAVALSEGEKKSKKERIVIKPRIEAIHAGRTRNDNIYMAEKLRGDYKLQSGIYSFTHPYPKPMLMNHDRWSEPTGRITNAQFITESTTGKEAVVIIPEITDPDAVEKVLDGRYMTVSIGASTDSATCNVCGTNIMEEGWCGHEKGEMYDDVKCGWITGNLWFDECSWVTVPADQNARVTDKGTPEVVPTESYVQIGDKYYSLENPEKPKELQPELAESLGLTISGSTLEQEGGLNQVPKPKKPEVAEGLEEKDLEQQGEKEDPTPEASVEEMTQQLEEKETKITEQETSLQEKDAKIQELEEQVAALTEEKTAMEEEKAALEAEKAAMEEEKASLEEEKQASLDQVVELQTQLHTALAQRVIDLKKSLGKPLGESEEEILEDHVQRNEESLKDSLNDLLEELSLCKFNVGQSFTRVTNPAGGAIEGEQNQSINGKEIDPEKVDIKEFEEVLKRLLTGKHK